MKHPTPALWVLMLLLIGLGTLGCAAAPSPPPPDLSGARDATLERTAQIERVEQWMERDLQHFVELRLGLAQSLGHIHEPDFPLALYRFIAISCLNEEVQPREDATIESSGDVRDCTPPHLDRLVNALGERELSLRDQALTNLERIDEMRKLRGVLRLRVARIPQIIQANQLYLVEQRAELRQLATELERRRSLYSREDFLEAQAIIAQQRPLLDALEDAIEALTVLYPEWPTRLDQQVHSLYMDLADLRE